jgi:hypothetical protein
MPIADATRACAPKLPNVRCPLRARGPPAPTNRLLPMPDKTWTRPTSIFRIFCSRNTTSSARSRNVVNLCMSTLCSVPTCSMLRCSHPISSVYQDIQMYLIEDRVRNWQEGRGAHPCCYEHTPRYTLARLQSHSDLFISSVFFQSYRVVHCGVFVANCMQTVMILNTRQMRTLTSPSYGFLGRPLSLASNRRSNSRWKRSGQRA